MYESHFVTFITSALEGNTSKPAESFHCVHIWPSIRVGSVKVVFHDGFKIFIENTEELGETRLESTGPK